MQPGRKAILAFRPVRWVSGSLGLIEQHSPMVQALVNQPFAVSDGRSLGLIQFGQEGMTDRERHAPGYMPVQVAYPATACPG